MKKTFVFIVLLCCFIQPVSADGTQPSGSGTSGEPYIISTLDHLLWISTNSTSWDKYFSQTADIDASATATWNSGAGWSPIGSDWDHAFYGQYNGGGYLISGLTISRSSGYQGFIGVARDGVVLQNINLTNVDIEMVGDAQNRVGALVGEFQGSTVTNCHVTGTVKGDGARIGGLIGQNTSTISNCSFIGTVTDDLDGSNYLGGLIGYNSGSIENSYTSVSITGNYYAGGLIGYNTGATVNSCYSTTPESNVVFGSNYVGGLVGYNTASSITTESFSTAEVVGYINYAGGLVGGNNNSTITNSYSRGSVTRSQDTNGDFGSFIGKNENTSVIEYCYCTGAVIYDNAENPTDKGFIGNYNTTGCSDNFFDTQASLQSGGAGATAKTTSEMNDYSTFESVGWDFKGESGNGSDDIWNIGNARNDGYPYFDWMYPGDEVPTPITLVSFDVEEINGIVGLSWQTASETENAAFRIYRDEVLIAEIEGAGTTTEPHSYAFTDRFVVPDRTYSYVLADVNLQGEETKHPEVEVTLLRQGFEASYNIGSAYPNPFNPTTVVPLNLVTDAGVTATLYDIRGKAVRELMNGDLIAGSHALQIDGAGLSTGIYFVHIWVNDMVQVQKIALMK